MGEHEGGQTLGRHLHRCGCLLRVTADVLFSAVCYKLAPAVVSCISQKYLDIHRLQCTFGVGIRLGWELAYDNAWYYTYYLYICWILSTASIFGTFTTYPHLLTWFFLTVAQRVVV